MTGLHARRVTPHADMRGGAVFDRSGAYRYRLWRAWDRRRPRATFVLLNPSTADATRDDPTIRRCIGFARRWGCGGIDVVNLFAFRATRVQALRRAADPVGPNNDRYLRVALRRASLIVAAWGNDGRLGRRDGRILAHGADLRLFCFGMTRHGCPRHPLYVRRDSPLVHYVPFHRQ